MTLNRELPNDVEAERFLLSCCMIDGNDAIARCQAAGLTPASFYEPKHEIVYSAFLDLVADQQPTDAPTLALHLKNKQLLDQLGGYAFVTQISEEIPTTAQVGMFIETVVNKASLRVIIRSATAAVEECYAFTGDFSAIDKRLDDAVRARGNDAAPRNWIQATKEAESATRERMKPPEQRNMVGMELSWGIADFDRYFQPLEPGELVVIGGYTSSGKSSLLRQILWAISRAGSPAMISTLEVRDTEEAINLAAHISGVRSRARLHQLHEKDQNALIDAFPTMRLPAFTVCHQDSKLSGIVARARAFKRKHGLAAHGTDYLQILEDVKKLKPNERPDFAIGCVTSELKRFATTESTVEFLLSGFNREYTKSPREPKLSDLDGSSSIEKDASRVLLLHIPEEYTLGGQKFTQSLTADSADQPRFFVKVIQAKGRNTGTSSVGLFFSRETKTFKQIIR